MLDFEIQTIPLPSTPVLSQCPRCDVRLAIQRVIAGRSGSEYWTMRCTRCGAIHLDVVDPSPASHAT
ncbi:MAG TPA: hypothetical protein VIJ35_14575 [Bradyrhizobium sp.]